MKNRLTPKISNNIIVTNIKLGEENPEHSDLYLCFIQFS